ncbi:right-handed parallel beta-helix repeat-containing protein [Bradyrhizobium sp. HKCCYLRH3099]|uniref:right-handed parallel beta-helix repeat-containing protein n=1 Tax=unclassified Bradyrhizobium TaxID=2631580 RepID=UPI003EBD3218
MRKLALLVLLAAVFAVYLGSAVPVWAQASRTWVSGVGDDANPCSRTAPCKTFAGAISKTAALGEINCIDPGGFGAVTITKSITIDCHEIFASVLNAGTNGIIINFDAITDARKTVRLRNLNLNGFDTGLNGIRIIGAASAGSAVFIEDCLIDGNFGGTGRGVSDERSGGGKLFVSRSTIRDNGQKGIFVTPSSGQTRIDVVIDDVRVENSSVGFEFGAGVKAIINRSVSSGNSQVGVNIVSGSEVDVDNSVVSGNGTAINNVGTARFANTDIKFNSNVNNGGTLSYGNNRIAGNAAIGTPLTAIGAASTEFGQQ